MKHDFETSTNLIGIDLTVISHLVLALALLALAVPMSASADSDKHAKRSRLEAQLSEFNGGCPPNECANVQFSVHRAPVCTNGPNENVGVYSISMVRRSGSNELAGGASTLVRAADGVAFNISSTGMLPNAPYTAWWVAFNPENSCIVNGGECTCGADDLGEHATVFYATGAMTDSLGGATFSAHVPYGGLPDGFDQVIVDDEEGGGGIVAGAELHIVLRGHGDALNRSSS